MYQHIDPFAGQAEQMMRLDQFESLVHHRRRIDADLGAHRPVGMGDRLSGRHRCHSIASLVAERAAAGSQHQSCDIA